MNSACQGTGQNLVDEEIAALDGVNDSAAKGADFEARGGAETMQRKRRFIAEIELMRLGLQVRDSLRGRYLVHSASPTGHRVPTLFSPARAKQNGPTRMRV